jgi:hypothetical protein
MELWTPNLDCLLVMYLEVTGTVVVTLCIRLTDHREPRSLLDKVDLVFSSEFSGSFHERKFITKI